MPERDPECPFCPGNEAETPPEILRLPQHGDDWRVRVVPNKFPALAPPGVASPAPGTGHVSAVGIHEVIVESPRHNRRLQDLDDGALLDVMRTYRQRFAAAARTPPVRHVILFRNQGPLANASVPHPHSQLVGLPVVPPLVEDALERSLAFRAKEGRSLLTTLADEERRSGARVLRESERFTAFVPYAASFDFEIWIVPNRPPPRFDRSEDDMLMELAGLIRDALSALAAAAADPDYNLIFQTPPLQAGAEEALPWFVQIIPRTTGTAGFEIGAGIRMLTVAPEEAAKRLRQALSEVARPQGGRV